MKVPNHEQAVVTQSKIVDYLLNEDHAKGKSKAKFFKSFGYTAERWEDLANSLKQHLFNNAASTVTDAPRARLYTIEGTLETPDERNPFIRSVWAINHEGEVPHLVTAYPVEES